jgi:hypothetical protein
MLFRGQDTSLTCPFWDTALPVRRLLESLRIVASEPLVMGVETTAKFDARIRRGIQHRRLPRNTLVVDSISTADLVPIITGQTEKESGEKLA